MEADCGEVGGYREEDYSREGAGGGERVGKAEDAGTEDGVGEVGCAGDSCGVVVARVGRFGARRLDV